MHFIPVIFTETATTGLTQILTDATTVYTKVLGWVGQTIDVIVAEPLLMVTFSITLGGVGISMLSRLIRR